MIKLLKFLFNPIEVNTYLVYDETGECIIIDAGCFDENENKILQKAITDNNLKPKKLICTHGHFDHVMGNHFVCETYGIAAYIHKNELSNFERAISNSSYFGLSIMPPPVPDHFVDDGDEIKFGNSSLKVIFTPGHTGGGICLHSAADEMLFCGDTLFAESIGRTDLPGGNYDVLKDSIKKLIQLPESTAVFCGHGPRTTIGHEKLANPFVIEIMQQM
ncbi:MAG: MBL fold metallo-hydrolase [Prevotellaceae bacterium]|jgi:glyoxylase-like metal-dependent hydrolase (beta-lactamase superfamily II)|nr:MBL fold metallo-hydrolase [Prevotellaceae bacterium]